MNRRILFVDDDANVLAGCQRNLRKDFVIDVALGGVQGLELISDHGPYAVVVADMQMPGMNGVQFLSSVKAQSPDTTRIMLTGNADQKTAREALNQGHIFRFLTKPCPPEDLAQSLKAALEQNRLITSERDLLERTLNGGVKMLTDILSLQDPLSFGWGQRLRDSIRMLAPSLQLSQLWELELAAMLSQIGCVTIPAGVLERSRAGEALSGPERDMVNRVPQIGSQLLSNIPRLETVAAIILYQKKNFDGTGFPADPVAGEQIPIGARLLHILHDILALKAEGISKLKALQTMEERVGRYDPILLETVGANLGFELFGGASGTHATSHVAFNDLRVGMKLAADLRTLDGIMIVSAGMVVSPTLLEKLRNFAELTGIKEPISVMDCPIPEATG
jgi:response regulator RpfG family c-di-GMP phosphodiesterase